MRNDSTNKICIIVTGDFCPINRIQVLMQKEECARIYNNFISVLRESDLAITNLECPLIEKGKEIEKNRTLFKGA